MAKSSTQDGAHTSLGEKRGGRIHPGEILVSKEEKFPARSAVDPMDCESEVVNGMLPKVDFETKAANENRWVSADPFIALMHA